MGIFHNLFNIDKDKKILLQLTAKVYKGYEKITIYKDGRVIEESSYNKDVPTNSKTIDFVDELESQLKKAYDKMIEIYDNKLYNCELYGTLNHESYKVSYNNHDFYSWYLFQDIKMMITLNKIDNLSIFNDYELNKKLLEIRAKNKNQIAENIKILDRGESQKNKINISDIKDNHNFDDERKIISFELEKNSNFEIGQSRFLSDVIDIADDIEIPQALEFIGQLNLNDLSKYDENGMLPKEGMLYFFQSPLYFSGNGYEFGKVIYSKNMNLKRKKIRLDDLTLSWLSNYSLKNISNSIEKFSSRFYDDNGRIEYDSFAGDKLNKIYGFYTDCQDDENNAKKVTEKYIVLLQLGSNVFGEGTTTFLITEEDLKNENFDNIIFTYIQS